MDANLCVEQESTQVPPALDLATYRSSAAREAFCLPSSSKNQFWCSANHFVAFDWAAAI